MNDRTKYVVRAGGKKANNENKNLTTLLIHANERYRNQAEGRCKQEEKC